MTIALFLELSQRAFWLGTALAAPLLLASLVVGFAVSIFQATTQINEMTLSFVPKIAAVFAALALLGPWMLQLTLTYMSQLLLDLPRFVR